MTDMDENTSNDDQEDAIFFTTREALADKVMEYFSIYEAYATDEGLHPSTIAAVHLGAIAAFNNMAISARDAGFLPEFWAFVHKLAKELEDNPSVNPYKHITDL
jgi:hypothetical protein